MSSSFEIAGRPIGPGHPAYLIAEIGINHDGDPVQAMRLIDAARAAGADAVKFQKRHLLSLYPQSMLDDPKLGEQGLQYLIPILKRCELSNGDFSDLHEYAIGVGIEFLCTPWDVPSVDFLETICLLAYKVGSPDLTNFPLLDRLAATGKPLILSTGMSTQEEIKANIDRYNHYAPTYPPTPRWAFLHCVSCYPATIDEANLKFLDWLCDTVPFGCPVGLSDHSLGNLVTLAAVARGASIIERHLTLDRSLPGPDHRASLTPLEFADLVQQVRQVEVALGDGVKRLTRGELLNRRNLAKSLRASCEIPAGAVIGSHMICAKGPGLGLSPQRIDDLVGKTAPRTMHKDDAFCEDDLCKPVVNRMTTETATNGADKISLPFKWGFIARFHDLDALARRFVPLGASLVEFHVSDQDLDGRRPRWLSVGQLHVDVVVHAPEYMGDQLVDLCSGDVIIRSNSIMRVQKAIDLARRIGTTSDKLNKVVFHAGGMTRDGNVLTPRGNLLPPSFEGMIERLLDSISVLKHDGVELLIENLPPFPWFFGGRWHGHVLTDPDTVVRVCKETGLGLCFDTSHAALWCNANGMSLMDYADKVQAIVRHLHVSDAKGVDGEGLQISEGGIDFLDVLAPSHDFYEGKPTLVPEIWTGHHRNGEGFLLALQRLAVLLQPAGKGVAP